MREWHDILETDRERSCHGMWVGFFNGSSFRPRGGFEK